MMRRPPWRAGWHPPSIRWRRRSALRRSPALVRRRRPPKRSSRSRARRAVAGGGATGWWLRPARSAVSSRRALSCAGAKDARALTAAAGGRHDAHRIALAVPADLAGLHARGERHFERIFLVPAADRAVLAHDPLELAVPGIGFRGDFHAFAGAGEIAALLDGGADLLLRGLGAADQGLRGRLRLAPRQLG